jgi:hypothetical protein
MNNNLEAGEQNLQCLRETLARLEREPDPYFSASAHAEFKRILIHRIALLERIAILEADASVKPMNDSRFQVQVHIRGVQILGRK